VAYPVITAEYVQARIEQWQQMLLVAEHDVERATAQLQKWENYEQEH
jgi:hypothetical protein